MKIKELMNSCQNQYKGLFGYKKDFKVILDNMTDQIKTERYWVELKEEEDYILNIRNYEVVYWEMFGTDVIEISYEEK